MCRPSRDGAVEREGTHFRSSRNVLNASLMKSSILVVLLSFQSEEIAVRSRVKRQPCASCPRGPRACGGRPLLSGPP